LNKRYKAHTNEFFKFALLQIDFFKDAYAFQELTHDELIHQIA